MPVEQCKACNGTGTKPGEPRQECGPCSGTGQIVTK